MVEPHLGSRVVALSVATRPDTLGWRPELLRLEPAPSGVDRARPQTADAPARAHQPAAHRRGLLRRRALKQRGLLTVGHAILGLPGDERPERCTARALRESGVDGVKVHQLMVLRRTVIEWWRDGQVALLDMDTYVAWLADSSSSSRRSRCSSRRRRRCASLVAPEWSQRNSSVAAKLAHELARRGRARDMPCANRARKKMRSQLGTTSCVPRRARRVDGHLHVAGLADAREPASATPWREASRRSYSDKLSGATLSDMRACAASRARPVFLAVASAVDVLENPRTPTPRRRPRPASAPPGVGFWAARAATTLFLRRADVALERAHLVLEGGQQRHVLRERRPRARPCACAGAGGRVVDVLDAHARVEPCFLTSSRRWIS